MNRRKASSRTRNRRETLKKADLENQFEANAICRSSLLLLFFYPLYPTPAAADDKIRAFTLLQMNDTYDLFPVPMEMGHRTVFRGGMAPRHRLDQEKRKQGPTLLLHAGDLP